MDIIQVSLWQGLKEILDPQILLYIFGGVVFGFVVGALPGLSASTGIILFLPLAYQIPAAEAIMVMLGIYGGTMFAGSIPAILIRTPGTPSAAATTLDGYPMAQKGEAGLALSTSAIASFVGSLLSAIALFLVAPQLARIALKFGPPEFFALVVFGLTVIAGVTGKDALKGLIAALLGLFLGTIGMDPVMGYARFNFGSYALQGGLPLLPVMIGLFAVSQVLRDIERAGEKYQVTSMINRVWLLPEQLKRVFKASLFGSALGVGIGAIPGIGGSIATFVAYGQYRKLSKYGEEFGNGVIEGVAVPEAANNATTGGALIPLLTLGIPGDIVTAVMLGILILFGVRPGPMLFREQPELVGKLFASMFVIAFSILGLGLLGARFSPLILRIPKRILSPLVLLLCVVGAYAVSSSAFGIAVALVFGVAGYFMEKFGFPVAPLLISMILGPIAEGELGRSLLISRGDWSILVTRPISLGFLILAGLSLVFAFRKRT
ncbi:tripartite tricarboxylate transporter permease [Thermatribacter velox]|jgi:putative tricarboxylic transport membrane protein|uniref:Tripartite tricarboxylate transporter permease n=1 Tax=Thermatribacter velox TaxID=3039681 RepID=A0ABZ2YC21_9BACT